VSALPIRLRLMLPFALAMAVVFVALGIFVYTRISSTLLGTMPPDGDDTLHADPARVEQALGNLVDNALVHGAGTVTLAERRIGAAVELHVLDRGEGVPGSFLPRAFDRFSRADAGRGHGGTGLGLAIVQAIASAHGGATGLRNRAGGGVDGWIAVPLELEQLRESELGRSSAPAQSS
jgi:signal transduction histidine kinase